MINFWASFGSNLPKGKASAPRGRFCGGAEFGFGISETAREEQEGHGFGALSTHCLVSHGAMLGISIAPTATLGDIDRSWHGGFFIHLLSFLFPTPALKQELFILRFAAANT